LFTALDHQDDLQSLYNGGTTLHVFLQEKIDDPKAVMLLIKTIAENYKLPFFDLTPTFSVCPDHGYLDGEVEVCPKCGKSTEVYSRVVGFYRPVGSWNAGKTQEFKDRKEYVLIDE
jgi:ribonucleoside-triphosphate reductase